MRKSWIVEYLDPADGEWGTALRGDTGRTMIAGYPSKSDALRRARDLREAVTGWTFRVVPCTDHRGVKPFPPYPKG